MQRKHITEQYSVSEQLTLNDVDTLAAAGVTLIICNRPDNEESGQLAFADIAAVAKDKGIATAHIPFSGGQMTEDDIKAFIGTIQDAENVHAFCRTGNRSTQIWQAAQDMMAAQAPAKDTSEQANVAENNPPATHYDVVVVGAGTAGISTAASLLKRKASLKICLVDPADSHFYQPGWTLVGGGVFKAASTRRTMAEVIPKGTTWLKEAVKSFAPEQNRVSLENGQQLSYDHLVVAAGIKLNWDSVEGLKESLGRNGVTSNYRYDLAPYTWELVQKLGKGKAVFTQPPMPIKCAGAPQKAMYLSCDHWFKKDKLNNIDVSFFNAGAVLFGVKDYVPSLETYIEKYQVDTNFGHNLVKVDGPNQRAYFATTDQNGEQTIVETEFDMLHVCPAQTAPDFIRNSPLVDDAGWVDIDKETLQHASFKNVWSLGDVTNSPNAKTMAAVRKQAPVAAHNILKAMQNQDINAYYDGYGSCPLTVERGKIVLAEFGFGGKLLPTFPAWLNDGTKPTYLAWVLKEDLLPPFYWRGMLKGHEWFVKPQLRK
ncbi:TIGR01244 family phosphatase [Marinomonas sp. A79]|uniref:TIGR01244 family phosphatase n=1 Tax=Marinomonas vulgaris TaxID=2823372 RepID=A0ABS5HCK6_9GAMM|nr:bifunctional protein tyrosine phosphatase family protein/NAD(P)/FAD-dependent oxidoreductase [Marinomonas vulgaris]MBR7889147.1 TIGR01244 family phosphatase [Marinomonas vulgaris]